MNFRRWFKNSPNSKRTVIYSHSTSAVGSAVDGEGVGDGAGTAGSAGGRGGSGVGAGGAGIATRSVGASDRMVTGGACVARSALHGRCICPGDISNGTCSVARACGFSRGVCGISAVTALYTGFKANRGGLALTGGAANVWVLHVVRSVLSL
jgi:hypothetical protein